ASHLLGQPGDHGEGAAELEGAGVLEVLALEPHLGADGVGKPFGGEERRANGDAAQSLRGVADRIRRDERAHPPISSSRVGAPPAGARSASATPSSPLFALPLLLPLLSSETRRATSTTESPSSSVMRRTPWVARQITRISLAGWRFTTPLRVISMSSCSGRTSLMAMTFPVRSVILKLLTPLPPRFWRR